MEVPMRPHSIPTNNRSERRSINEIKLINLEKKYLEKLQLIVEVYIPKVQHQATFVGLDMCGRIDLIYAYHDVQLLPAFVGGSNIIDCFLKHEKIFDLYATYLRYEPYIKLCNLTDLKILTDENEIKKSLIQMHLKGYMDILEDLKNNDTDTNEIKYNTIIDIIKNLLENSVKSSELNKEIGEIIKTERSHFETIKSLQDTIKEHCKGSTYLYKHSKTIMGKIDYLYTATEEFLNSLEDNIYSFDIHEIMNCFLKHEALFELYIDDSKLKNNLRIKKLYEESLTLKLFFRLTQYKLLLDKTIRICKKDESFVVHVKHITKVYDMMSGILNRMNDMNAVKEIFNENISIGDLGLIIKRGNINIKIPILKGNPIADHCFLFEKALVFTKEIKKQREHDSYKYIFHILSHKMQCKQKNKKEISLIPNFSDEKDDKFILQGSTEDIESWFRQIQEVIILNTNNTY